MTEEYAVFLKKRESILQEIFEANPSSSLELTQKEEQLAKMIENLKTEIVEDANINLMKGLYENLKAFKATKLYQLLNKMPKGVLQHVHLPAAQSIDSMIRAFTSSDKVLYSKTEKKFILDKGQEIEKGYFRFCELLEQEGFEAIKKEVSSFMFMKNEELFDQNFEKIFDNFEARFIAMGEVCYYEPVLTVMMEELYADMTKDQLSGVEIRHLFGLLIKENMEKASHDEELEYFRHFQKSFAQRNPPFEIGYIHCGLKTKTLTSADIKDWFQIYQHSLCCSDKKNTFMGFDMVAFEGNKSVEEMAECFTQLKKYNPGTSLILHSGENTISGTKNAIDAILLGSKRLGHGLIVSKNPVLIKLAKERDICIEINPISNYILGFARDPFNHPLRVFINNAVACTINSDDYLFWDCPPMTMDFFVSVLFSDLNLREIKWLILNSISYSYFNDQQKAKLLGELEGKWNAFLGSIISDDQATSKYK